jgi:hypothetical protein
MTALISPTQAAERIIDFTRPSNYLLGICQSKEQLDCLEPEVTVNHQDGSVSLAKYMSSQFSSPFVENINLQISGAHRFKYSSGTSGGYSREFDVRVTLATPGSNPLGILETRVISTGKKLKAGECNENLAKLCSRYTLDPEDNFTFVVRSQKIPVHWMGASAKNGDVLHQEYLTGDKWIFKGAQELIGWNPGLSWSVAAFGTDNLSRFHKDIPRCSQFGVLFLSSNGVTGGLPSWNKNTNSLNFGVFGPHFDANGDLYKGFFKARIPKQWLDCTYPENTLSMAEQVVVNITYDDGTVQIATTHTKITDQVIYIDVPILHFSSPTIRISNAALVAKAAPKPSPKTLNCLKGKVKKKFLASKCPSGWKLVA